MRLLITGANGLLGQKLVGLLEHRSEVTLLATGRGGNRNPIEKYRYYSADLSSRVEASKLIRSAQPDVVIHCAAMTQVDDCEIQPDACHQSNLVATQNLLEAVNPSVFFLLVSTDFVFDGVSGPYQESDLPNPISIYGHSKLEAEQLVQQSNLRWAIARTVLVYGVAHDLSRSNLVLWVKKNLEEGKPIRVVTDQWRTPTLAEDLAEGCWLIVRNQQEGVFHLSGAELVSPFQMALKTAQVFGLDSSLISPVDSSTFTQPAKRPPKTGFIIEKAKKSLGFTPRSLEEGLALVKRQLESA